MGTAYPHDPLRTTAAGYQPLPTSALTSAFVPKCWSAAYRHTVSIPVIRSASHLHFNAVETGWVPFAYPDFMRKPRKYVSDRTGAVSWRVRYRSPEGTEKSETFYDEPAADEFAGLVHALGAARALAYIDKREAEGDGTKKALTVSDLWGQWRAWKGRTDKRGNPIEVRNPRTLIDYDRMWKSRIKPRFGHIPANLVSQVEVQQWIDSLTAEIEAKTIADYHGLVHSIYLWGIHPSRALVVNDPCLDTKLPTRQKKRPKGLRPNEWAILHQAAREVDQSAADLLLFMVSTGWRWSECAAVQAMSVDHWTDEDGRPRTFVTMGRVLRREGNTFAFVDDAKSEAGERRIELVGPAADMVLRRIYGKPPTALVFTTKSGGQWRYEHFYRRYWRRPAVGDDAPNRERILEAAKRLGLDRPTITPHWLRHTHVGMLILAGEPLTAIQKRLGHATIKTTSDVYGRMIEDASAVGLDRVAAMISGVAPPPQLPASDKAP